MGIAAEGRPARTRRGPRRSPPRTWRRIRALLKVAPPNTASPLKVAPSKLVPPPKVVCSNSTRRLKVALPNSARPSKVARLNSARSPLKVALPNSARPLKIATLNAAPLLKVAPSNLAPPPKVAWPNSAWPSKVARLNLASLSKVTPRNRASPLKIARSNRATLTGCSPRRAASSIHSRRALVMGTPRASISPVSPIRSCAAAISSSLACARHLGAEGRRMPMHPARSHAGPHSTSVCSAIRHPSPRICAYASVQVFQHRIFTGRRLLPCLVPSKVGARLEQG